jgi:hypothetical protein
LVVTPEGLLLAYEGATRQHRGSSSRKAERRPLAERKKGLRLTRRIQLGAEVPPLRHANDIVDSIAGGIRRFTEKTDEINRDQTTTVAMLPGPAGSNSAGSSADGAGLSFHEGWVSQRCLSG